MIIVKVWGGIGNQLFQYVFGQYLHHRFGEEVCYDDNSFVSVDRLRKRELDALSANVVYDNRCVFSRHRGMSNRLLRFMFQLSPRHHFIKEGHPLPKIYHASHVYFFQGYWQDINYYEWLQENVPSFAISSRRFPKELEEIKKLILSVSESTSVHVRRGDYFTPKLINTFGVCDAPYFERAMKKVLEEKPMTQFFVFSDDLEWVKNNVSLPETAVLVPNYEISQFAYIELMSLCRNHIISNSSFSWWGAVLNNQVGTMVISPRRWLLTTDRTIAKKEWIKID